MGLIATIVIGALAGWIAGQLLRGSGYGIWLNLGLGLVGSIVGSWLGSLFLGVDLTSGFNLTTLVTSVVGAVVVVFLYRLVTRRSLT